MIVNAEAGKASRQASSAAARHATLEVVIALCMFLLVPLLQEMRWPLLRNDDVPRAYVSFSNHYLGQF